MKKLSKDHKAYQEVAEFFYSYSFRNTNTRNEKERLFQVLLQSEFTICILYEIDSESTDSKNEYNISEIKIKPFIHSYRKMKEYFKEFENKILHLLKYEVFSDSIRFTKCNIRVKLPPKWKEKSISNQSKKMFNKIGIKDVNQMNLNIIFSEISENYEENNETLKSQIIKTQSYSIDEVAHTMSGKPQIKKLSFYCDINTYQEFNDLREEKKEAILNEIKKDIAEYSFIVKDIVILYDADDNVNEKDKNSNNRSVQTNTSSVNLFANISFDSLNLDEPLLTMLNSRLKEAEICFNNECYLSTFILNASIIEALLSIYDKLTNTDIDESQTINNKFSKKKLVELIDNLDTDEGLTHLLHFIRMYRNFIHFDREVKNTTRIDEDMASIAINTLKIAIKMLKTDK